MLKAYGEIKELWKQRWQEVPELEFVYHYDVRSFFSCFDFLNVSKVADIAGINASLMRRYSSGAKAGPKQKKKLNNAINEIIKELSEARI